MAKAFGPDSLAVSCFYGLEGAPISYGDPPIACLPGLGQTYGNEAILPHAHTFFGDDLKNPKHIALTLIDVWVLNPEIWSQLNTVCWVPVDHEPAPPAVIGFFEASGAIPIAFSRFGERQLEEAGLDPLYVPHGVHPDYQPMDKVEARKMGGLPTDAFVCGVVAANKGNAPPRKAFPEILQAFKQFQAKRDDAVLFLHTEITGRAAGVELNQLMGQLEIPQDSVYVTDQERYLFRPLPPKMMSAVFSAFDVLLHPSRGEGFGLPALESQACGTPVIGTRYSAMPEVIGAGWLVDYVPEMTPQMSWQALPSVDDIVESLEHCYTMSTAQREALSTQALQHAGPPPPPGNEGPTF